MTTRLQRVTAFAAFITLAGGAITAFITVPKAANALDSAEGFIAAALVYGWVAAMIFTGAMGLYRAFAEVVRQPNEAESP